MKNNITKSPKGLPTSGDHFAKLMETARGDDSLEQMLFNHFNKHLGLAMQGPICEPRFMTRLYPILREINADRSTEEIDAVEYGSAMLDQMTAGSIEELAKLISLLVNHEQCPEWLRDGILDSYGNRSYTPDYSASYWLQMLTAIKRADEDQEVAANA